MEENLTALTYNPDSSLDQDRGRHSTLAWFDRWDEIGPLKRFITPRMISNAGFNMRSKVAEVLQNGSWLWPNSWVYRFPVLQNMHVVELKANVQDRIVWRTRSGDDTEYSTSILWNDIRQSQPEVIWERVVWFPQAIPRHSFLMWLIIQKKLKTQDVMSRWISSGNANFNLMCCSLCIAGPDSHDHIFFECAYVAQIWNEVRGKAGMGAFQNKWDSIYTHLVHYAKSGNATHIIGKIIVGATAYFVWQERNQRLFTTKKRTTTQLVEIILRTVRMKLYTFKFKRTSNANRVLQDWRLPRGLLMDEDDGD